MKKKVSPLRRVLTTPCFSIINTIALICWGDIWSRAVQVSHGWDVLVDLLFLVSLPVFVISVKAKEINDREKKEKE